MLRITVVAILLAGVAGAQVLAPALPSEVLDQPLSVLEKLKGKGEYSYGVSAEGKSLADVDYNETWFGLPDPVKAQYIVSMAKEADPKIIQITLGFKNDVKRDAIIKAASVFLGIGDEGKSGDGAPSEYYANWVRDAVRYDLQDFGDYREMYISTALFSYADTYKLKEPVYVVAEATEALAQSLDQKPAKAERRKVMLLGIPGSEGIHTAENPNPYTKLSLYVCHTDSEEKGKLVPLPDSIRETRFANLSLLGATGDGVFAAVVDWGNHWDKVIVDLSVNKPAVMFDSTVIAAKVSGSLADGEVGTIKFGDDDPVQIDVHGRYGEDVYKDGKLLRPVPLRCGAVQVIGTNYSVDYGSSLQIQQDIIGLSDMDVVASLNTTYKLKNGVYEMATHEIVGRQKK